MIIKAREYKKIKQQERKIRNTFKILCNPSSELKKSLYFISTTQPAMHSSFSQVKKGSIHCKSPPTSHLVHQSFKLALQGVCLVFKFLYLYFFYISSFNCQKVRWFHTCSFKIFQHKIYYTQ